ncbi:SPOR domain-containing protein [Christiangramia portivictoriae]|uniref:SPOR domain-containing protein n=1 Tax=Christiangramia portivictoriae TaxID=326069 RepID=UPI000429BF97|nr:SPOR domain-containing protein [Christiangramia portivictoriae]
MKKSTVKYTYAIAAFFLLFHIDTFAQQATVQIQQSKKIDKLVEIKKELSENNKIGDRFVIQLFYGDNGQANEVIQKYRNLYEYPSKIAYEAPNYKVWVGNFRNRLEADRALLTLKDDFPSAFIPKPQRK